MPLVLAVHTTLDATFILISTYPL